jgi:hypothetical protein
MKEIGIVGGFISTSDCTKALVIYTERPVSADGVFDFGLVSIAQIKPVKDKDEVK